MSSFRAQGGPPTHDVYLGNLPPSSNESKVSSFFKRFGEIKSVSLYEGKNDNPKYGFVRYIREEDALKACEENGKMVIDGSNILIRKSNKDHPKKSSGGGSFGGGSFGGGAQRPKKSPLSNNKPDLVASHPGGNRQQTGNQSGGRKVNYGDVKRKERLLVTHVDGPLKFWGQEINDNSLVELQEFSDNLQMFCSIEQVEKEGPPVIDTKFYGARFSEDKNWYRCVVKKYVSENESYVQYIDYGNGEVIKNKDLMELPVAMTTPPRAKLFILYGLKPNQDPNTMGYEKGTSVLREMIGDKECEADIIESPPAMTMIPVILMCNGIDVNQEMLNQKFGEKRLHSKPSAGGKPPGSLGKISPQAQQLPGPLQTPPLHKPPSLMSQFPQMSAGGGQHGGFSQGEADGNNTTRGFKPQNRSTQSATHVYSTANGNSNDDASIGMWDPSKGQTESVQRQPPWLAGAGQGDLSAQQKEFNQEALASSNDQQLKNELWKAKQQVAVLQAQLQGQQHIVHEYEKVKTEREKYIIELAETRGLLKNAESEFTTAVEQLQESGINNKINRLATDANIVKCLRRQFPTDDQYDDLIQYSLDLMTINNVDIESFDIIPKVKEAQKAYFESQRAIKKATSKDVLDDLIKTRDTARNELYDLLVKFIDELSQQPLSERASKLHEALCNLDSSFGVYLQQLKSQVDESLLLTEVTHLYAEWKSKKHAEFQDVRTSTNTCHNAVNSALRTLQQQLSLYPQQNTATPNPVGNLETLLNKFQGAISREIGVTDMTKTDDCAFLKIVLRVLTKAIQSELADIRRIQSMFVDNLNQKNQLEPWLEARPNTAPLVATRKTIKSLKSKLRHKLADKEDMEESDDEEREEYKALLEELTDLRTQLHQIFLKEDEHLAQLADLSEHHFPELILQYMDLGLDNEGEYRGLVKLGRALDQFDVVALPGVSKTTIWKSSFCGNPIVLKEYIVDEVLGIKKSDFIRKALAYHDILNPHVLSLEAVFFVQNDRQVYLQMPHYSQSLSGMVETDPEVPTDLCYRLLQGVMRGLHSLHEARLVHGALHPNNVFISSDNQAVIAEFDFSRALKQRSEKVYTASNGLKFVAPEAVQGDVSRAADMYNLGLLALWLHYPSKTFSINRDGIPDITPIIDMGESFPDCAGFSALTKVHSNILLYQLLTTLLVADPSERCTINDMWQMPYFIASPHVRSPSPTAEGTTLQLRAKTPSPRTVGGGILKNSNSGKVSPTSGLPCLTEESTSPIEEHHSPMNLMGSETGSPAVMPCSTMGTPINTPIEGTEVHEQERHGVSPTRQLVSDAVEQATQLAGEAYEEEMSDSNLEAIVCATTEESEEERAPSDPEDERTGVQTEEDLEDALKDNRLTDAQMATFLNIAAAANDEMKHCPYDETHEVLESNYEKHIAVCNKRLAVTENPAEEVPAEELPTTEEVEPTEDSPCMVESEDASTEVENVPISDNLEEAANPDSLETEDDCDQLSLQTQVTEPEVLDSCEDTEIVQVNREEASASPAEDNASRSSSSPDPDVIVMTGEHKSLLNQHRSALSENMVVDEILPYLQSRGVFTEKNVKKILKQESLDAQNKLFLDLLLRKPDHAYTEFIEALKDTEQEHVANILCKKDEGCDE